MHDKPTQDLRRRSFEFAARIIKMCKALENQSLAGKALLQQLIRSGTSVGANIEEAQAGQSKADFTAKMYIACKEARETHYWLRLFAETELVSQQKLEPLLDESNQLVAILTAITKKARSNS